ncbi:hypothetical protein AB0D49_06295 [Streptomyces sp. NPDC048290]|uniref:hypothetical protein n=1 Tax=Streptomyces sp. NPDC048290 TaxID=3155811 RepID=UPI00342DEE7F
MPLDVVVIVALFTGLGVWRARSDDTGCAFPVALILLTGATLLYVGHQMQMP